VVEDELGAPVERLVAEFSTEPFAAASLSQVHRAVTLDGRAVAVKVQRPGIAGHSTRDLTLPVLLARRLERRRLEARAFREGRAGSVASLLLRQLALGARSGIVFPRDLMLLARALLVLEGTARVIAPDVGLAELARRLMPELERPRHRPGALRAVAGTRCPCSQRARRRTVPVARAHGSASGRRAARGAGLRHLSPRCAGRKRARFDVSRGLARAASLTTLIGS